MALYIVVHDHVAMIASDHTRVETYRTHAEVWLDIFTSGNLVWNKTHLVHCIRLSSEVHEELSNFHGASARCAM